MPLSVYSFLPMKPIKIVDIETLNLEKERVQLLLEAKQKDLAETGSYIRANSRKIIWAQLNPFKGNTLVETAGEVVSPLIQTATGGTLKDMAVQLLKDVVLTYGVDAAQKFLKKKKKKKKVTKNNHHDTSVPEA